MKNKNIIMSVVAAMSVMGLSQLAHAEFTAGAASTIVTEAKTQTVAANAVTYRFRSNLPAAGHKIRLSLGSGATFNVTPKATSVGTLDMGSGANVATPPSLGGAGQNFAEWSVNTGPSTFAEGALAVGTGAVDGVGGIAAGTNPVLTLVSNPNGINKTYTVTVTGVNVAGDTATITAPGMAALTYSMPGAGSSTQLTSSNGVVLNIAAPTTTLTAGGTAGTYVLSGAVPPQTVAFNLNVANTIATTAMADGAKADLTLTEVNGAGTTVVTAKLSNATGTTDTDGQGNFLVLKKPAVKMNTLTANNDKVTVKSGYLNWKNGVIGTLTETTRKPTITIAKDGIAGNGSKSIVTLTGDFTGIQSITTAAGVVATGSDSAGVTTNGAADEFLIAANKKTASLLVTNDGSLANLAPVFVLDGATAQTTARTFQVSASLFADATYNTSVIQAAADAFTLNRDGSVFTLNSFGPANTLKISDRSNNVLAGGANIAVTAYDAAGTKLTASATATVLPKLPANGSVSISGTTLLANFTGAPVRFEVSVDSSDVIASNVKKTTTGVTVSNLSSAGNGSL